MYVVCICWVWTGWRCDKEILICNVGCVQGGGVIKIKTLYHTATLSTPNIYIHSGPLVSSASDGTPVSSYVTTDRLTVSHNQCTTFRTLRLSV
jgi:hypothetical protein